MIVYKQLTVNANLSGNQINANADVSGNINADADVSGNINAGAQMSSQIHVNYVSDYDLLQNKPQINSVTLQGDKSFDDLGLEGISNMELENMLKT
jgi:hypothetical protein